MTVKFHFIIFFVVFINTVCFGISLAPADVDAKTPITKDDRVENKWYESWDKGMAAAKKEKKPVLVDFTSNHCPACRAMEKDTFSAPEIQQSLAQDWISVRINTSHQDKTGTYNGKTMNYYELSKYFRVTAVPTFIFIDREGKPVQSVLGYKDKELFGQILDYMKDEIYKKGIPFKEYRKKQKTPNNE